ncbi:MAG TPA: CsbD family protein [bacterium]|nr:CsbD family protein [bacterium]
MNSDQFKGKWRQMRGSIKKQWGKMTDDELDQIGGNYDMLVGKIQERYGNTREDVERRLAQMDRESAA